MSVTHGGRGVGCLAAALVGAAGLLAGCTQGVVAGGGASPQPGSSTVTASEPAAGGATAQPSASGTPAPTGAGAAACRSADLRIARGRTDALVGHRAVVAVFTNIRGRSCRLQGYPGVAGLLETGTRQQYIQARHTLSGYLGGLGTDRRIPMVTLAPGQSASAMVEAFVANQDGSACTPYRSLVVSAPGTAEVTTLPWGSDGCADLAVHPVVPGTSGRAA